MAKQPKINKDGTPRRPWTARTPEEKAAGVRSGEMGKENPKMYRKPKKKRKNRMRQVADEPGKTVRAVALSNGKIPYLKQEIRLPSSGDTMEVKVRDGDNTLQGTVSITTAGISFKRPNAKPAPGDKNKLTWSAIDQLQAIGFLK
jgi:hypothetical protein